MEHNLRAKIRNTKMTLEDLVEAHGASVPASLAPAAGPSHLRAGSLHGDGSSDEYSDASDGSGGGRASAGGVHAATPDATRYVPLLGGPCESSRAASALGRAIASPPGTPCSCPSVAADAALPKDSLPFCLRPRGPTCEDSLKLDKNLSRMDWTGIEHGGLYKTNLRWLTDLRAKMSDESPESQRLDLAIEYVKNIVEISMPRLLSCNQAVLSDKLRWFNEHQGVFTLEWKLVRIDRALRDVWADKDKNIEIVVSECLDIITPLVIVEKAAAAADDGSGEVNAKVPEEDEPVLANVVFDPSCPRVAALDMPPIDLAALFRKKGAAYLIPMFFKAISQGNGIVDRIASQVEDMLTSFGMEISTAYLEAFLELLTGIRALQCLANPDDTEHLEDVHKLQESEKDKSVKMCSVAEAVVLGLKDSEPLQRIYKELLTKKAGIVDAQRRLQGLIADLTSDASIGTVAAVLAEMPAALSSARVGAGRALTAKAHLCLIAFEGEVMAMTSDATVGGTAEERNKRIENIREVLASGATVIHKHANIYEAAIVKCDVWSKRYMAEIAANAMTDGMQGFMPEQAFDLPAVSEILKRLAAWNAVSMEFEDVNVDLSSISALADTISTALLVKTSRYSGDAFDLPLECSRKLLDSIPNDSCAARCKPTNALLEAAGALTDAVTKWEGLAASESARVEADIRTLSVAKEVANAHISLSERIAAIDSDDGRIAGVTTFFESVRATLTTIRECVSHHVTQEVNAYAESSGLVALQFGGKDGARWTDAIVGDHDRDSMVAACKKTLLDKKVFPVQQFNKIVDTLDERLAKWKAAHVGLGIALNTELVGDAQRLRDQAAATRACALIIDAIVAHDTEADRKKHVSRAKKSAQKHDWHTLIYKPLWELAETMSTLKRKKDDRAE